jgi:hypothetical protein
MSTPLRLAAFFAVLALVGLAGFGLGRVTGPVGPAEGGSEQASAEEQS